MPGSDLCWRHVVICTLNSWLPGDPRGFRTRDHKLHSSGDYKHRPPRGEHTGLHRYSRSVSGQPVIIPPALREAVGRVILDKIEHRVLALAAAGMHTHLLAELPVDLTASKRIIGRCKATASHAIRNTLPGRVWAHDGDFKPIRDYRHHRNAYRYILDQDDAWIWDYRGA